ncbi:unnamed protein product [Closterium sp. NIES-53]
MPGEPTTLKEDLESSDAEEWKKAMESELKSIEENGTWELVELPDGRKAITSKWLFKIKSDADGKIERYKSRLVAKGYQQKEKVDYKELFAPVVKLTTLRTLLAGAAIKGWVVKQMDVTTAFLNSVLEEEIFMAQPEGFDDGSGREVMLKLQDKFKCKALGDVNFYLGLHIEREVEKRCMRVHQRKYLEALAAKFWQSEGHVATPFPSGFKCVKGPEEESVGEEERRRFHSLVGSLMYAAVNTRPDVAFATGHVGGFICCVGGGPTAWESKKQVDQALSSVESEYMALFRAVREIVWQRRLLAELGEEQQGPIPLYCDSQGAIALAKNPVLHGLTKHMRKRLSDWTPSKAWNHKGNAHTASGKADGSRESIVLLAGDGTNTPSDAWFLDTGATQHMTHSASFLTNVGAPGDVTRVVFGNNKSLPVFGVGSTRLIVDGGPVDIMNGEQFVQGVLKGELYQLKTNPRVASSNVAQGSKATLKVWHNRLAHANYDSVKELANKGLANGFHMAAGDDEKGVCAACVEGKMVRQPFGSRTSPLAKNPLALVHMDVCGPMRCTSKGGARFLLVMLDDAMRMCWTRLLKAKGDVTKAIQEWALEVCDDDKKRIKAIRTDGGGEFVNAGLEKWMKSKSIKHDVTTPYTPQQNGST